MIRKLALFLITLLLVTEIQAQFSRPKFVVGIVVDQMRCYYLYYYYNDYGANGLRLLLNEGFSFQNTQIDYAPTVTSIGHSSIFTGSVPAFTGIAGNNFYDDDKPVYCCYDPNVESVGSTRREGKMSPHRMLTSTIGDELGVATDFRSKVVGIALKDRGAILPAGHSANAAYWWDTSAGHFVSSTFYMTQLPKWVEEFNKKNHTEPKFNIKTSLMGVTLTFRMAEAALKNERLGQGKETDMLTVSISPTDAIGHEYSTRGKENREVYMQLDKDLAHFLKELDSRVGRNNYLLFLTADHGAAHNYNYMKEHRIPAGAWSYETTVKQLNEHLQTIFGIMPVMKEDNYQFYLNDSVIAQSGRNKQEVIDEAINFLLQDPQFLYVFDQEKLGTVAMPEFIRSRMLKGYFRGRSGEIGVVTRLQYFGAKNSPDYRGTSHGQPFVYDTHIPWVMFGWGVQHGESFAETYITDIAPTICAMLHIQMPNGSIGKIRLPLLNEKDTR